jgi:DNA-binding CsgD family transcriptional regulator
VDGRRGLIVIGEKSIDNFSFGALLAHEWRHHYQRFNARLYYDEPKRSSEEASYKEKTIAYYTTSRCEYDALSFECAMAPNDGSLAQLEWVRQYEEKVLTRCATRSTMQFMATSLTSRQEEILRWVCEGKTEAEIGIILNISEYTVASHINNIRERLDINKNALLVRWAIRNQLVTA